MLEAELAGQRPAFAEASLLAAQAPATRAYLARRAAPLRAASAR
jgi:hypothetical protein